MQNPEIRGGEAQALVRVMPLYLWGPRVSPKQGQHLRSAPRAARPGRRSRDHAKGELGALHHSQTRARCNGGRRRGPEEEGSETGTCGIPLPTTEHPMLCRGLPKTCGRLSSGRQLKHAAEEPVKTCCWPALLWGCAHSRAPGSRAGGARHRPPPPRSAGAARTPQRAPRRAPNSAGPAEPARPQQSRTCPQVTYTSDRRRLRLLRAAALGSEGCRPARGRRLLVCLTAKNKSSMKGGPLGSRTHICSPPSGEGQLAADLSRTAKMNFFNPILV